MSDYTYCLPVSEEKFFQVVISELKRKHSDMSWEVLRTATLSIEDLGTSYYVDGARGSRWDAKGINIKFALPSAAIEELDKPQIKSTLFDVCQSLIPSEVGYDLKGIIFIPDLTLEFSLDSDIDTLTTIDVFGSASLQILSDEIKKNLKEDKPELALDRLHTFSTRFFRQLCTKYKLPYDKEDGLHTLFGKYRKHLEASNIVDSNMTLQILKVYANILSEYNQVRNNRSFAHDNQILNSNESKLICSHIIAILKFIDEVDEMVELIHWL
ncbi:abortive infection family protein [Lysinibacillus sp. NPDC097231]|uniref:abortive infection family protein n=1 Tax=Lysinibacillus sp. NPDC097231 TaxID=3364142 RepID=UPI00382890F1